MRQAPLATWFWALVLATYTFVFLTTIDAVLLKLAEMSLLLKLLELPLYVMAYALLLPSIKIIYGLLLYPFLCFTPSASPAIVVKDNPHPVVLLYPTYDDFNAEALLISMAQSLPFSRVYILDDSKTEEYKTFIDLFALNHPTVEVVRRRTVGGFKAGNMNAFLRQREDYHACSDVSSTACRLHRFIHSPQSNQIFVSKPNECQKYLILN